MALEWQYQLPSKRTYAERSTAAYDLSGFNKGSLDIRVTCGQIIAVVDTAAVAAVVTVAIAVAVAADVAVDAVAVWCCCNESLTALKKRSCKCYVMRPWSFPVRVGSQRLESDFGKKLMMLIRSVSYRIGHSPVFQRRAPWQWLSRKTSLRPVNSL